MPQALAVMNIALTPEPPRAGAIPAMRRRRIPPRESSPARTASRKGPSLELLDRVYLDSPMPHMPAWMTIPRPGVPQISREYEEEKPLECPLIFYLAEYVQKTINRARSETVYVIFLRRRQFAAKLPNTARPIQMLNSSPRPVDSRVAVRLITNISVTFLFTLRDLSGEDFTVLLVG